jgi:hypothetical protein
VVLGALVGTFVSFFFTLFDPRVVNKAGPDWFWGRGRDDLIRNLYFRPNGTFRRYGRAGLMATLVCGSAALYWFFL